MFSHTLLAALLAVPALAAPVNVTHANVTAEASLATANATASATPLGPAYLPVPAPPGVNLTSSEEPSAIAENVTSSYDNKTHTLFVSGLDNTSYTAQPYVANGYLGVRLPVQGQGFATFGNASNYTSLIEDKRFTGAYLAGFNAHPAGNGTLGVEGFLATIPGWSQLSVTDESGVSYNGSTPKAQISNYSQSLSLENGVVSTNVTWTASESSVPLQLNYTVLAHRARPNLGLVRLDITASEDTTVNVTDLLDGTGSVGTAYLASGSDTGSIWTAVSALGSNNTAFEYSTLAFSNYTAVNVSAEVNNSASSPSISQTVPVTLAANTTFTIIKYVGIASSDAFTSPFATARKSALVARALGFERLLFEHASAWNNIWADGDIVIPGDEELQKSVRASLYHLVASVRSGEEADGLNDNGVAVGGLSSSSLTGLVSAQIDHVSPALLAIFPQFAKSIVNHAVKLSESPKLSKRASVVEPYHTSIDTALSAWNYYVSTNDSVWLNESGYALIADAADFYASKFSLNKTVGAYTSNVTVKGLSVQDSSYVNAGAVTLFGAASAAADLLGETPSPEWAEISENVFIATGSNNITLPSSSTNLTAAAGFVPALTYPLVYDAASNDHSRALKNFQYYSAQIEKKKVSATDAATLAIDSSALSQSGSGAYTYLLQASQPFLRKPYYQFSESEKEGKGSFPYLPGVGSFLQIFTHGFTGFRPQQDTLFVDPSLPPQLPEGYAIKGFKFQGQVFDINVTSTYTYITRRGVETLTVANGTFGNGTFFTNGSTFNATNTSLFDATAFANFTGLNVTTLPHFNWTALGANLTVSNITVNDTAFGYFNFSSLTNLTFGDLNVTYWGGLNVSNVTLGDAHTLNITDLGFGNATLANGTFFNHTSFGNASHNVSLPLYWELPAAPYNGTAVVNVESADAADEDVVYIQIGRRNSAAGNYSIKVNQTLIVPTYRGDLYFKNIEGNEAENVPVSSADSWHPARFPVAVNDGDNATYWQPANSSRAEVILDLGSEKDLSEAVIVWGPFQPKNFSVGVLPNRNGTVNFSATKYANFTSSPKELAAPKALNATKTNHTLTSELVSTVKLSGTGRYITLAIEGVDGKNGKHPGSVAEFAVL